MVGSSGLLLFIVFLGIFQVYHLVVDIGTVSKKYIFCFKTIKLSRGLIGAINNKCDYSSLRLTDLSSSLERCNVSFSASS